MTTLVAPAPGLEARVKPTSSARIESIDLLRGIIMIIMVLDHARDYFNAAAYVYDPTDLSKTSVVLFLTRWITHFCAPVFILLSGISAFLYGQKNGKKALSFFLLTRGAWLVLCELFIVTFGWTFNPAYPAFVLQVIWAIGACMMILSALIYLNRGVLLAIGILLVAGHNLLDGVHVGGTGAPHTFWLLLHEPGGFQIGSLNFVLGYPIMPWLGVMIIGYVSGSYYSKGFDAAERKRVFARLGWALIAAFLVIRLINVYGDRSHWQVQQDAVYTILSFLNVSKYPPSLLYILMTLGPAFLFLAYGEKPLGRLGSKIIVFGRVPMFYYLVHIFLLHALAMGAAVLSGRPWYAMVLRGWVTSNTQLQGYGYSLGVVYLIWLFSILVLYPFCKWYGAYKQAHLPRQPWLSYI